MATDYSYSSSVFLNELMFISTDIVWKNKMRALKYEQSIDQIEVEQFMVAKKGMLNFDTIYAFDESVLLSAGMTPIDAEAGAEDKSTIPVSLRDTVTRLEITYIINNYEEKNDYYRMLNGLPSVDDTNFVYNTKYPKISDSTTPIHKLSLQQRFLLENNDYIQSLIDSNPEKEYLKYIAEKNIDIYTARNSEAFDILWIAPSDYENINIDFRNVYYSCRYALTKVYYSSAMNNNNEHYEGFIAMCILFMTIQIMHSKFLEADITRDFYDLESLKYVYDSYGVPFYSSIPLEYHKKIVKNINRLISYKGSTRVFFELFDLFDFASIDINEYYLLKLHKFENGKPVFVKNPDGSYNNQQMYDIKFGKVKIYNNPPLELSNTRNHIPYNTMIVADPYWITDEELLNTLYNSDFNYTESKYIGIQTVFNLMKIIYESSYFIKMITDNRKSLQSSVIYVSSFSMYISIFDLIIYIACLVCNKYGYDGAISTKLSTVSKVMGFNFKDDIDVIINNINSNSVLSSDKKLLDLLTNINVISLVSANASYKQIYNLREYIGLKISQSKDSKTYFAYYNLYNTLMYSEYIEESFVKSNGSVAESFEDLLSDINPTLYTNIISGEITNYQEAINEMLYLIKLSCNNLSYIENSGGIQLSEVIDYLFKIMDFFKSAKADLTGYNITYTLSSRYDNMLKLLGEIKSSNFEYIKGLIDKFENLDDILILKEMLYGLKSDSISLLDSIIIENEKNNLKIKSEIKLLDNILNYIELRYNKFNEEYNIHDYIEEKHNTQIGKLNDLYGIKDMLIKINQVTEE